ncbi:MAG: PaaI family thioesterase [Minicystis sp.]
MKPQNPLFAERIRSIFDTAPFVTHLGIELLRCEPGLCETRLLVQPWQMQQDAFIHAGVQATLADHTAGAAAGTLMAAEEIVLTIEFKINLLRPAQGEELFCRATVLRPGAQITVAESEVFARRGGEEKLTAKAMVTLALVRAR